MFKKFNSISFYLKFYSSSPETYFIATSNTIYPFSVRSKVKRCNWTFFNKFFTKPNSFGHSKYSFHLNALRQLSKFSLSEVANCKGWKGVLLSREITIFYSLTWKGKQNTKGSGSMNGVMTLLPPLNFYLFHSTSI